jgi:hypothetical protein
MNEECCKKEMDLIGVTEEGNFKFSCSRCHTIIEVDSQSGDIRIIHRGNEKEKK